MNEQDITLNNKEEFICGAERCPVREKLGMLPFD
jgi:hypothetical protein